MKIFGYEIEPYTEEYIRKNGVFCDYKTVDTGGPSGYQYFYTDTLDIGGECLYVQGLVYEEYPNGMISEYATCNETGFPGEAPLGEFYDDGALKSICMPVGENSTVGATWYDNGNIESIAYSDNIIRRRVGWNINGVRSSDEYSDGTEVTELMWNDASEIEKAMYRDVRKNEYFYYSISDNKLTEETITRNNDKAYYYGLKNNVMHNTDLNGKKHIVFEYSSQMWNSKKIFNKKRIWNSKGKLISRMINPEGKLYYGNEWDDNGKIKKEYIGTSDFLSEFIFDENECVSDCALYLGKYEYCPVTLEIISDDIRGITEYNVTDSAGHRLMNAKHSSVSHKTKILISRGQKIKTEYNTECPAESAPETDPSEDPAKIVLRLRDMTNDFRNRAYKI